MKNRNSHLARYLQEWRKHGKSASEGELYHLIKTHIFCGILGYASDQVQTTPKKGSSRDREGIPDLRVKASDDSWWIPCEAKTDDQLIRDGKHRNKLWQDKQKYVTAETAYFLWAAPNTFVLCQPTGQVIREVHLDAPLLVDEDGCESTPTYAANDEQLYEALECISANAAKELRHLERFRETGTPDHYLKVAAENLDQFTSTLNRIVQILQEYLQEYWHRLRQQHPEYLEKKTRAEEAERDAIMQEQPEAYLRQLRKYLYDLELDYRPAIALEEAFAKFCEEQAYTGFRRDAHESEQHALERIFRLNASYVILGRLLFVRLAEDHELIKPKISNGGLDLWRQLTGELEMVDQLVATAFRDTQRICRQLFRPTPFDALLGSEDINFDKALLRVLYQLNAFDLSGLQHNVDVLGNIYQGVLPRKLRKDLGEFYTDPEVVEYIVRRSGFVEPVEEGRPVTLLDPACGSGAFLVKAADFVRQADKQRGVGAPATLERIRNTLHGLDINHFAVYVADMNMLFSVFDLATEAREPVAFSVHCINSLVDHFPTPRVSPEVRATQPWQAGAAAAARADQYDFVIGNPPYVRMHRLPQSERDVLASLYLTVGENSLSRTNVDLAVYFLLRAVNWLKEDGTLGFIITRGIADASYAQPVRNRLEQEGIVIEEIVPLDWVCRDLFQSDVVPMILIVRRAQRPKKHHVRLVQGIQKKDQLVGYARNGRVQGVHTSILPWSDFAAVSEGGWPLEVVAEDLPILQKLKGFPRVESIAQARRGVEVGTEGKRYDLTDTSQAIPAGANVLPMTRGADVHAFYIDEPTRAVDITTVNNRSWWGEGKGEQLSTEVVAVPEIHVTLNAAPLDRSALCAQNTVTLLAAEPSVDWDAHSLAALLNSHVCRYFAFLLLRCGIAGGGRRDFTIYPRTLKALPVPSLNDTQIQRLSELAQQAQEAAQQATVREQPAWEEITAGLSRPHMVADWPLNFTGWPDEAAARHDQALELATGRRQATLQIGEALTVTGDEELLRFIQQEWPQIFGDQREITNNDLCLYKVPTPEDARKAIQRYEGRLEEVTPAQQHYYQVLEQIDALIEEGFGLTDEERETIHRRMNEFPLSETANRPRLPWEETVAPGVKHFGKGERYHGR